MAMETHREIEIKLSLRRRLPLSRLKAALRALGFHVLEPGRMDVRDTYLDTADFWFFRAGVACRLRRTSRSRELCLKTLRPVRGGFADRLEFAEHLPPATPRGRQGHLLPGRKIAAILKRAGVEAVVRPLFVLRQRRSVLEVVGEDGLRVAVSLDTVFLPGKAGRRFEIELELFEGEPERMRGLARRLQHCFRLTSSSKSKFELGIKAAGIAVPRVPPRAPRIAGRMPVDEAFARLVAHHVRHWEWNHPGVLLGIEPDKIHDFRVALRRLSVVLRLFKPWIYGPVARGARRDLKWLSALTGPVRDCDIYLRHLYETDGRDVSHRRVARAVALRRRAHRRLVRALAGRRCARLRDALAQLADRRFIALHMRGSPPRTVTGIAPVVVKKWLVPLVGKARVAGDPKALHKLRRRCRRIRYATEIMAAAGIPGMEATAGMARDLQAKLGHIQDRHVIAAMAKRLIFPAGPGKM